MHCVSSTRLSREITQQVRQHSPWIAGLCLAESARHKPAIRGVHFRGGAIAP